MCANFQAKQTTLTFLAQIFPKIDFGVRISKIFKNFKSSDSESAPPRYHVYQFSVKMDNFEFNLTTFKFGEVAQLRAIFGSNNVEGVAESWVETKMSWVEVDGAGCTG